MAPFLYPRIRRPIAIRLIEQYAALVPEQLVDRSQPSHPNQFFTPTGGVKVPSDHLIQLQDSVRAIAGEYGYPKNRNQDGTRRFDRRCARLLHERMAITSTEASRGEVWSFFGCVLLPDIVAWRYFAEKNERRLTSAERFLGGVRNTFQRLWWRAYILHDTGNGENPYHLLDNLGEDQFVQIWERPSIPGNLELSRAMARTLVRVADGRGITKRMELMREAAKRVRRLMSTTVLEAIDPQDLSDHVMRIFNQSADAMEIQQSQSGSQPSAGEFRHLPAGV